MKEKIDNFVANLLELPPKYFYAAWVGGLVFVVFVFWFQNTEKRDAIYGSSNDGFRYQTSADTDFSVSDLHQQMRDEASEVTRSRLEIEPLLRQLASYATRRIHGDFPVKPEIFFDPYSASGIDRDKFASRIDEKLFQVQRWQKSASAPKYSGDFAFEEMLESAFHPWLSITDFRVDFEPYQPVIDDHRFRVNLRVECSGSISETTARQATAIWSTEWVRQSNQTVDSSPLNHAWKLASVSVLAQEEVAITAHGRRLMLDCTSSIFARCPSLKQQLAYGLDQWARRIPHLDVVGHQGLAIGDVNGDGLDDMYICQAHGLPNLLFTQNPNGTVDDVSQESHVDVLDQSYAALFLDLDNDKDQDLVITCDEALLLLSNNGKGVFQVEQTLAIGRGAESLSAADYDQDGDLDLFLCKPKATMPNSAQSALISIPQKITMDEENSIGGRNVLLRNDEGWQFRDVTEQAGITVHNHECTRCAVWVDFDRDGAQDLLLANEFAPNRLYRNDRGWFTEVTDEVNINKTARHRTVSVGEFNQDGKLDFFLGTDAALAASDALTALATDKIPANASDQNQAAEESTDIVDVVAAESRIWMSIPQQSAYHPFYLRAPLFSCQSAMGSCSVDLNNDGLDDVVVANGFLSRTSSDDMNPLLYGLALDQSKLSQPKLRQTGTSISDSPAQPLTTTIKRVSNLCRAGYSLSGNQRNRCFLGIGSLGFANASAASGLDFPDDARAVATTDWDQDGDADIVMTCRSGPQLRVFCNQSKADNSFISFSLAGTKSNADAIGTRLELYQAGVAAPLVKTLQAGSGFLSQSSKQILFGLGQQAKLEKLIVTWPSGESQTFAKLTANRRYHVVEGQTELAEFTVDRFRFSIHGKSLTKGSMLPETDRAVFYPAGALPKLMFQGDDDKFFTVKTLHDQPLLIVFFSQDQKSMVALNAFWKLGQALAERELDCLGLYCAGENTEMQQIWKEAQLAMENSRFPFRWGALTPASLDKLKYVFGEWFANQQTPNLPCGLLLDGGGQVRFFYAPDQLDPRKVLADAAALPQDAGEYRQSAAPLGGFWTVRYRAADYMRLARRLDEAGYHDDVEELLLRNKPFQAYQLSQQGIEVDSLGDTVLAKALFEKAIELDSNCTPAFVGSANALRKMAALNRAESAELAAKYQLEADEDYSLALKLDPRNAEAVIGRANVAIEMDQVDAALQHLTEFLERNPLSYDIQAIIGRLMFAQQRYQEAGQYLAQAFDNRPTLPYVAGDLGFLYLTGNEYKLARKFLLLAHRLQPSDRNISRLLGEAEFLNGNYNESVKLLETVIRVEPNLSRPKTMLAWIFATSPFDSSRNGKRALELVEPLLKLQENRSPSLLEIQAAAFAELGQFEQAVIVQRQALQILQNKTAEEIYAPSQRVGLNTRLELYQRQRPYRNDDNNKNPIRPPGLRDGS